MVVHALCSEVPMGGSGMQAHPSVIVLFVFVFVGGGFFFEKKTDLTNPVKKKIVKELSISEIG